MCSNVRLPFVVRQVAESSHCTAEGLPVRCSTPSNPFAALDDLFCISFQGQADSSPAHSTLVVSSALVRQCYERKRVANWKSEQGREGNDWGRRSRSRCLM